MRVYVLEMESASHETAAHMIMMSPFQSVELEQRSNLTKVEENYIAPTDEDTTEMVTWKKLEDQSAYHRREMQQTHSDKSSDDIYYQLRKCYGARSVPIDSGQVRATPVSDFPILLYRWITEPFEEGPWFFVHALEASAFPLKSQNKLALLRNDTGSRVAYTSTPLRSWAKTMTNV